MQIWIEWLDKITIDFLGSTNVVHPAELISVLFLANL